MSNDKQKQTYEQFVESLKLGEALATIQKKTAGAKCPMCGNVSWFIEGSIENGAPKPLPAYVILDPRTYFEGSPSFPVISLSCSECGFVRLHNVTVVNKA